MNNSKYSAVSINNTLMRDSLHTVNKFKTNIKNLLNFEKNEKKLTSNKEKENNNNPMNKLKNLYKYPKNNHGKIVSQNKRKSK